MNELKLHLSRELQLLEAPLPDPNPSFGGRPEITDLTRGRFAFLIPSDQENLREKLEIGIQDYFTKIGVEIQIAKKYVEEVLLVSLGSNKLNLRSVNVILGRNIFFFTIN